MKNKLVMVQSITPRPADYHGFTVKPGMFYGVVKTPFGNIPAAWSGWTCGRCIALYTLLNGEWSRTWCDDEEIPSWHIAVYDAPWSGTGDVPFFAE